jgi:hypothetical protein
MQIQRSTAVGEQWLRGLLEKISDERGSRVFRAARSENSTQCLSHLFPLSAVLFAESPSMLRSFLPMCFTSVSTVGSALRGMSIHVRKLPPNMFQGRKRSPSFTLSRVH